MVDGLRPRSKRTGDLTRSNGGARSRKLKMRLSGCRQLSQKGAQFVLECGRLTSRENVGSGVLTSALGMLASTPGSGTSRPAAITLCGLDPPLVKGRKGMGPRFESKIQPWPSQGAVLHLKSAKPSLSKAEPRTFFGKTTKRWKA